MSTTTAMALIESRSNGERRTPTSVRATSATDTNVYFHIGYSASIRPQSFIVLWLYVCVCVCVYDTPSWPPYLTVLLSVLCFVCWRVNTGMTMTKWNKIILLLPLPFLELDNANREEGLKNLLFRSHIIIWNSRLDQGRIGYREDAGAAGAIRGAFFSPRLVSSFHIPIFSI